MSADVKVNNLPETRTCQKTLSCKGKCLENVKEFCNQTTFHGLKFVGNPKISYPERILFGAAFTVYFIVATYFVFDAYRKWCQNPIYIGINPKPTYINEIPFPAVTICNMNKAILSKVKNFKRFSEDNAFLQTLCGKDDPELKNWLKSINSLKLEKRKKYEYFEDYMVKVAPTCEDMFLQCEYGSIHRNCGQIFQSILLESGLCCTFNALHLSFMSSDYDPINFIQDNDYPVSWNPEHGYPINIENSSYYPRPAYGTGSNMGLRLILDAQFNEYYCSSTNGAGFKVAVHSPAEEPFINEVGINVAVGTEAQIRITPELHLASEPFRNINVKYRNCLFLNERNLSSYKIYSRRNCELECEAKQMVRQCGCILYFQPIVANVSICGIDKSSCIKNVTFMSRQQYIENFGCKENCPPSCFDLNYEQDVFTNQIHIGDYYIKDSLLKNVSKNRIEKSITILNFFYKDRAFYGQVKDEFTGMTDFFSSTGGLLGLFLGFSCISIVEIIYFCTLRPIFIKYRTNKN